MEKISQAVPVADQIEIVPMGDVHFGSPNCRVDKFKDQIKYIADTKNCYTILMGDLMDCIYADDKRLDLSAVEQTFTDGIDELTEMLIPIKGKILVGIIGNHEYVLRKKGIGDPIKWLSGKLNFPYGGYSCFLKLKALPKTHAKSLVIYMHHGWFSGRKRGGKVNNLEGIAQHYVADVYLAGHSHDLWATRAVRVDYGGARSLLFANTGTFMETASYGKCGYSERAGYPPQKLGSVKIKWYPKTGKVYASE